MLPAVSILKKKFPEARITLLADKWVLPLKEYFKDIDYVIIVKNTFSRNVFKKFISAVWLVRNLSKKKFDLALIGHRNNIFGRIAYLTGIKYRLGFSGTAHVNYPVKFDPALNESERYLKILENIGLNISDAEYRLSVKRSREEIINELNFDTERRTVGIFPFGGVNPGMVMTIKRWGKQNYLDLADKLYAKGFNIILFEGNQQSERLTDTIQKKNFVITEIDIDKIYACDIFIGNDTGALHIASAFNKKIVGIFGPTDENIFGPSFNVANNIQINKRVSCSPCFNTNSAFDRKNEKYWRGNEFICHTGTHICMKEIKVEEVYDAVIKNINEKSEVRISE